MVRQCNSLPHLYIISDAGDWHTFNWSWISTSLDIQNHWLDSHSTFHDWNANQNHWHGLFYQFAQWQSSTTLRQVYMELPWLLRGHVVASRAYRASSYGRRRIELTEIAQGAEGVARPPTSSYGVQERGDEARRGRLDDIYPFDDPCADCLHASAPYLGHRRCQSFQRKVL